MQGKIVKGISGFYYVHVVESGIYECKAKGIFRQQKMKPLVGDDVEIDIISEEKKTGNVAAILPRKNALIRPAVVNVDQALLIFAAASPNPNFNLLDRFLVMMGRLRVDEAFLLQLPHVLCHRIFTHADCMADGFVTGVALVGLTILAPEQIGVEGYLPVIQTNAEYLVGHHKIVFLCTALGPFVETQFIPPVLL